MFCCLPGDFILFHGPFLFCESDSRKGPHMTNVISYVCKTKPWDKLWSCLCHIRLYGWKVLEPQHEQLLWTARSQSPLAFWSMKEGLAYDKTWRNPEGMGAIQSRSGNWNLAFGLWGSSLILLAQTLCCIHLRPFRKQNVEIQGQGFFSLRRNKFQSVWYRWDMPNNMKRVALRNINLQRCCNLEGMKGATGATRREELSM